MASGIQYSEIPERGRKAIEGFLPDKAKIAERDAYFAHVKPRPGDKDGHFWTLESPTQTTEAVRKLLAKPVRA